MKKIYHLAVESTLDIIAGKWKLSILCNLGNSTMRTGELLRAMPGVSQRVLTKQLRELEEEGIIDRRSYNEVPPRVEYSLTDEGKSLREILVMMSEWGKAHIAKQQSEGAEVQLLNDNDDGFRNM